MTWRTRVYIFYKYLNFSACVTMRTWKDAVEPIRKVTFPSKILDREICNGRYDMTLHVFLPAFSFEVWLESICNRKHQCVLFLLAYFLFFPSKLQTLVQKSLPNWLIWGVFTDDRFGRTVFSASRSQAMRGSSNIVSPNYKYCSQMVR